ncbi:hypothetical protein KAR91_73170 [Candidatus Pacearchaeota archaeon]|nr:hypothetical protein [Candidatus Pacearchaeota archaeon]
MSDNCAILKGVPIRILKKKDGTEILQFLQEILTDSGQFTGASWVDVPMIEESPSDGSR